MNPLRTAQFEALPLPQAAAITITRERGFQPPYHTVAHYTCPKCGHVTNLRVSRGGFPPGAFGCANCGTVMPFGRSRRKGSDRRRGPLTDKQELARRQRAAAKQHRDRLGRFG